MTSWCAILRAFWAKRRVQIRMGALFGRIAGVRELKGKLSGEGRAFGIVVSRFNAYVTARLLSAAVETLKTHGCMDDAITCVHVPGAFELPLAAKRLAESGRFDAILCLGCVIRGETPHFEYVAAQAAAGVMQASLMTGVPIAFGVITADTLDQAIARCGGMPGNKGVEAALCAIEMVELVRQLPPPASSK